MEINERTEYRIQHNCLRDSGALNAKRTNQSGKHRQSNLTGRLHKRFSNLNQRVERAAGRNEIQERIEALRASGVAS